MTAATSGEANTVFSKDKYSYTGTKNNENLLRLGVNETRNLRVEWARDKSHGFQQQVLDVQIVSAEWNYVVYSFENIVDVVSTPRTQKTEVTCTVGANQSTPYEWWNYFLNDKADYNGYIGNSRSGASSYSQQLQGFIYDLQIYQVKYQPGVNGNYGVGLGCHDAPTATSCWTVGYNTYTDDGIMPMGTCDASCDTRGCRDDATCTPACDGSGGNEYCNLCFDKLCTSCTDYTTCTAGNCESNAIDDGNNCRCSDGYVREADAAGEVCNDCFGECATCEASTTGNYSDCTACLSTHWAQTFDAGIKSWCTDYCPSGFTQGSQPSCTEPIAGPALASWSFAGLTTPWTHSSGFNITPTGTSPSPARGAYVSGIASEYLRLDAYTFPISVTISGWIWLIDNQSKQYLFAKDDDQTSNVTYFGVFVQGGVL